MKAREIEGDKAGLDQSRLRGYLHTCIFPALTAAKAEAKPFDFGTGEAL
tara:strand:- start:157 stop:303 length:147 start_codon:yes stop_codon:yes gene_type:complete